MADEDLRTHAAKRIKDRRQFWTSSITLVVVFAILVVIWAATSGGSSSSYFWPMWPGIAFAIAIVFHAIQVFSPISKPISDAAIDAEVRKLGGDPDAGKP